MTGILIDNGDRPDIIFESGFLYGGLHCGDCFEIFSNQWISVRLEYLDDWVIVHDVKPSPIRYGVTVQI